MRSDFASLEYCDDPLLLIPGSLQGMQDDAAELRARGRELRAAADELARRDVTSWMGQGSYAWRTRRNQAVTYLDQVAEFHEIVAAALTAHTRIVGWARQRARVAVQLWAHAKTLGEMPSTAPVTPSSRGGIPISTSDPRYSFPAGEAGDCARLAAGILSAAQDEVALSAEAAARVMDEMSAGLPDGRFHAGEFIRGIGDWIAGIAELVYKFNYIRAIVDGDAMQDDAREMGEGLRDTAAYLLANPHEVGPVLFNTDQLRDNPGRWWGNAFPDLALTAAGGVGLASKAGWFARFGRNLDDLPEGAPAPYPPGSPWADPAARQHWVDDLIDSADAHRQPSTELWAEYQRRVAGDYEYDLRGGGEEIRADGIAIEPDAIVAIDAKFTSAPGSSPYTGTAPPGIINSLLRTFDDEVRRYGLVMADSGNPVARLRIVANTPEGVAFLTARARGILGEGFDVVGVLEP